MEEQLRKEQLKKEQEEADLILAQWRKEEKQREEERVLLEADEERSRAIQAEKEAARIERGKQTILARQRRQEEEERRRLDVDHKLALVARMVAEETVSRAASQLSVAMHRGETSFVKEETREEKIVQTCESEKSKSEVRVAKDLDAEVLRLGIMSPATPQVKMTLEHIFSCNLYKV